MDRNRPERDDGGCHISQTPERIRPPSYSSPLALPVKPRAMQEPPPTYPSGDDIRIGDRIMCASSPGLVAFVIASRSFSAEYPEEQWSYLGRGFMIETERYGLIHLDEADEDLVLIERAQPCNTTDSAHL